MYCKIFVLLITAAAVVLVDSKECSRGVAIKFLRTSSYKFSMRLLDRMAIETRHHFIFSPLSTWIQLSVLLEGARGTTLEEIKTVTDLHKSKCSRRSMRKIVREMKRDIYPYMKTTNAMLLDSAYDVKLSYIDEVKHSGVEIFVVDFDDVKNTSDRINDYLFDKDLIGKIIFPQDFQQTTILTADAGYFISEWRIPFQLSQTNISPFYNEENVQIGEVNLMKQMGLYNITTIPTINAKVLEIECNERISMLLFLPVEKASMFQVYESLLNIRLKNILLRLQREETKNVEVSLPRFEIVTDIDNLPELLYDMGAKKLFYPKTADFHGISDYKLYVSMVQQKSVVQVTEGGIYAKFVPEMLISGQKFEVFKANRPFLYMVIDKPTELILFAGMYSKPSLF